MNYHFINLMDCTFSLSTSEVEKRLSAFVYSICIFCSSDKNKNKGALNLSKKNLHLMFTGVRSIAPGFSRAASKQPLQLYPPIPYP